MSYLNCGVKNVLIQKIKINSLNLLTYGIDRLSENIEWFKFLNISEFKKIRLKKTVVETFKNAGWTYTYQRFGVTLQRK